ncbi:MAG TPA: hypothetical protein VGI19_04440 [Candidatus Cybelea sp.]|jgi:hypothetical protein
MFAVLDNPGGIRVADAELESLNTLYFIGSVSGWLVRDPRVKVRRGRAVTNSEAPATWRFTRLKEWQTLVSGIKTPSREIDDEMAKLPIAELLPCDSIIEYIVSGWRPELDRKDGFTKLREAIQGARARTGPKTFRTFVDFDHSEQAARASTILETRGFEVHVKPNGKAMSVTTRPLRLAPNWIEEAEEEVMSLVRPYGGRYAGNEAEA